MTGRRMVKVPTDIRSLAPYRGDDRQVYLSDVRAQHTELTE